MTSTVRATDSRERKIRLVMNTCSSSRFLCCFYIPFTGFLCCGSSTCDSCSSDMCCYESETVSPASFDSCCGSCDIKAALEIAFHPQPPDDCLVNEFKKK